MFKTKASDFNSEAFPWDNVQPPREEVIYTYDEAETEMTHFYNLVTLYGEEPINKLVCKLKEQDWSSSAIAKLQTAAWRNSYWNKDSWIENTVISQGKKLHGKV